MGQPEYFAGPVLGKHCSLFNEAEWEVKAEIENISVIAREAVWYFLKVDKKKRM